jgi:hypothetical protein
MIKYAKFKFNKNIYDCFWFLDFSWNTFDIWRNIVPGNIVCETLIYGINHFMTIAEDDVPYDLFGNVAGCCPVLISSIAPPALNVFLLVFQCLLTLVFVQCAFVVEPGHGDIGLCVTSPIALDTLWYQLIPFFSTYHHITTTHVYNVTKYPIPFMTL